AYGSNLPNFNVKTDTAQATASPGSPVAPAVSRPSEPKPAAPRASILGARPGTKIPDVAVAPKPAPKTDSGPLLLGAPRHKAAGSDTGDAPKPAPGDE
ncbi:MAG: hypothetical protein JO061_00960, partial [Acidobacteriaceae bacterium]|nr:hypothetical protein [Acidobacteriaceae bacterium]